MNNFLATILKLGLISQVDATSLDEAVTASIAKPGDAQAIAEFKIEQAFKQGLLAQNERLFRLLGGNQNPTKAQWDAFWQSEDVALLASVQPAITQAAQQAAIFASVKLADDGWRVVNEAVIKWTNDYYTSATEFGSIPNLNLTSRQQVATAFEAWQRGELASQLGLPSLALELQPTFGEKRAQTIAATETTRIYSEATRQTAIADEDVVYLRWLTSADEIAAKCPICGPLHGRIVGKKADGITHPQGLYTGFPPAHPRCRCRVVEETAKSALVPLRDNFNPALPKVATPVTAVAPLRDWPKFSSVDSAQTWAEQNFAGWRDDLDFQQEEVLGAFKGGRSGVINGYLRGHDIAGINPKLSQHMVKVIDGAFDVPGAIVDRDVSVWRGMRSDLIDDLRAGRSLESVQGLVIKDKGFPATTLSQDVAEKNYGVHGVVAEIRVPMGAKAIYLDVPGFHNYDYQEYEMLLPRDTQFKILSAKQSDGITRLILEVIQ